MKQVFLGTPFSVAPNFMQYRILQSKVNKTKVSMQLIIVNMLSVTRVR